MSEKRYFKQHHAHHQLVELFDIIQEQKEYDEAAAKAALKNKALLANFKIYKTRLFNYILSSLQHYHLEKDKNIKLLEQIALIYILLKKEQYEAALELLETCKQQCLAQEEYELSLQLLNIELRHLSVLPNRPNQDALLIGEMTTRAAQIQNYMLLQNLLLTCKRLSIWRKPTADKNSSLEQRVTEATTFLNDHILNNKAAQPLSPKAQRIYHSLASELYFVIGDYEQTYQHCKARVQIFQASAVLMDTRSAQYFAALANLNAACIRTKRQDEFIQNQVLLDALFVQHPDFTKVYFSNFRNSIRFYKQEMQWENIITLYDTSLKAQLKKSIQNDTSESILTTVLVLIEAFLLLKQYKKAKECFAFVDVAALPSTHRFFDFFVVIEIVYYIELSDVEYLKKYAQQLRKKLKEDNSEKLFLESVLTFAQKFAGLPLLDYAAWYEQHLEKLANLEQQDASFATFSYFFSYVHWLTAKAKNIDWKTYLSQNPPNTIDSYR